MNFASFPESEFCGFVQFLQITYYILYSLVNVYVTFAVFSKSLQLQANFIAVLSDGTE